VGISPPSTPPDPGCARTGQDPAVDRRSSPLIPGRRRMSPDSGADAHLSSRRGSSSDPGSASGIGDATGVPAPIRRPMRRPRGRAVDGQTVPPSRARVIHGPPARSYPFGRMRRRARAAGGATATRWRLAVGGKKYPRPERSGRGRGRGTGEGGSRPRGYFMKSRTRQLPAARVAWDDTHDSLSPGIPLSNTHTMAENASADSPVKQ
jgi:hypothetical protein